MKILIISHAHPDFSVGGAEVAAYNLYNALKQEEATSNVVFLAGTDNSSVGPGVIKLYQSNEYLWRQGMVDWFRLRSQYPSSNFEEFREFLEMVRPTIIFVQHYIHLGVEILKRIRDILPYAILAVTLHEFLAICNRNGQFVKNNSKKLCYKEEITACSNCFPEYSDSDFWLRKHYIQRHFENADVFISPSHFLKQRYVDWGIPAEKMHVIENGQPRAPGGRKPTRSSSDRIRFGFFGQINEYKGVEVLLQAIGLLPEATRKMISVEIHGANLEKQGPWFQDLISGLRKPLIEEGCLRWAGAYEPRELHRRMGNVDWVVVPSIWWENSPMVIQEAFVHHKPVICSNIGGMAEKVRDGVDGLHFEVRNPLDLSEAIKRAADEPGLCQRLSENVPVPPSYSECAEAYMDLVSLLRAKKGVRRDQHAAIGWVA